MPPLPTLAAALRAAAVTGAVSAPHCVGAGCAVVGLLLSALFNLPSGPAVVLVQLLGFLIALALAPRRS